MTANKRHGTPPKAGIESPGLARMLHPTMHAFIDRTESFYPASANTASPAENRAIYDRMCAAFRQPRPVGVIVTDTVLQARDPDRGLKLRHYRITGVSDYLALLYLHGGGYVVGGLDSHDDVCAELCARAGIMVIALDYRLAPENIYPAALDDAEAAYSSLVAVERKVIVAGDSAGGCLAAALCLRLKRLAAPLPIGQALVYPGLGGNPFRSGIRNLNAPLLRASDTMSYRDHYGGSALPENDPEFAPLCAADVQGLPRAAIFSAGIDPLRQDAEDYAALLEASGVEIAYRNDPGLVHGYLRARNCSPMAKQAFDALIDCVRTIAGNSLLKL